MFECINLANFTLETVILSLATVNEIVEFDNDFPNDFKSYVKSLIDIKDFKGKLGETKVVYPIDNPLGVKRIYVVGLGKLEEITYESIRRAFGTVGSQLRKSKIYQIGVFFTEKLCKYAESVFEGLFLGNYRFFVYKTSEKQRSQPLERLQAICPDDLKKLVEEAYNYTQATVQGTVLARDLGNTRSNHANPAFLADEAMKLSELGINVSVLDVDGIKKEKMNLFLAVAQGSIETEPPKFIIMEYIPKSFDKTLCLIGKGITFDTGGISLKQSTGMEAMIYDMCGAGAVIGAMKSIVLLKPNIRVIGLVPATPNVPDARSYRPGDIITSRSQKKVEIISTDAEGRNLLADTLDYAKKYDPDLVIDFATLTGACVIALGHLYAGYYLNDEAEELKDLIFEVAQKSGDYCWQMPLDKDYFEYLKSTHADFKHTGGRWGGSVTAAMFLKQFVDYPWIHIDIAGTAWKGGLMGAKPRFYNAKEGATGFGVRLITEFIRNW